MSNEHENETKPLDQSEMIFNNAFFAALTGLSGRSAGQDPGTVVNEAYVLAERAAERFSTGQPVMTDAQRSQAVVEAAQAVADGKPTVSGPNVTQLSGRFQRPAP